MKKDGTFFNVLVDLQPYRLQIAGNDTILKNYEDYAFGLFCLDLNPIYIRRYNQDFRVIPPYLGNNKSLITHNGYIGFYNSLSDVFVAPRFLSITNFYNAYAIARYYNEHKILRSCGNKIIVPFEIIPIFFNGYYLFSFDVDGNLMIMDRNFNSISDIRFPNYPRPFVFQNLVFFQFGDTFVFYTIENDVSFASSYNILAGYFKNVFYYHNFIVLKNFLGEYSLFDDNFNLLGVFEFISFSYGTMRIRGDYRYYFYEILS